MVPGSSPGAIALYQEAFMPYDSDTTNFLIRITGEQVLPRLFNKNFDATVTLEDPKEVWKACKYYRHSRSFNPEVKAELFAKNSLISNEFLIVPSHEEYPSHWVLYRKI